MGARHTRTRRACLVDIAAGLGERTLAVQSAALPSNQVTAIRLGHAAGAKGAVRLAAERGKLGEDSCR